MGSSSASCIESMLLAQGTGCQHGPVSAPVGRMLPTVESRVKGQGPQPYDEIADKSDDENGRVGVAQTVADALDP